MEDKINQVCRECGISANVLTCLKKYGNPPKQLCFNVSTVHFGKCDYCGEEKHVTEARDYFYPDFSLLTHARNVFEDTKVEEEPFSIILNGQTVILMATQNYISYEEILDYLGYPIDAVVTVTIYYKNSSSSGTLIKGQSVHLADDLIINAVVTGNA